MAITPSQEAQLENALEEMIAAAIPGLALGVLSLLFIIFAAVGLCCKCRCSQVICGDPFDKEKKYSPAFKTGTAVLLIIGWIGLIVAFSYSLAYGEQTYNAVSLFMDDTAKVAKQANIAFAGADASVQASSAENLESLEQIISDVYAATKNFNSQIDFINEKVQLGNEIRYWVVVVGMGAVIVGLVSWLFALLCKVRCFSRLYAFLACLSLVFGWFSLGVQMPMATVVDLVCNVYDNVATELEVPLETVNGTSLNTASDLAGESIPEPIVVIAKSCVQTNNYVSALFQGNLNDTVINIDTINQVIENLPPSLGLTIQPLNGNYTRLGTLISDHDVLSLLQGLSTWLTDVQEQVADTVNNLPAIARRGINEQLKKQTGGKTLSDISQMITDASNQLNTITAVMLSIISELSCIQVKIAMKTLSETFCEKLEQGLISQAFTFGAVSILISLTYWLTLNAFEQRVSVSSQDTAGSNEPEGVPMVAKANLAA